MLTGEDTVIHSTLSPEIFIPDDNIVNTQESAGVELGSQEDTIIESVKTVKLAPDITLQESVHEAPVLVEEQVNQERRRSERLKETTSLHTMEKGEKLAKKWNLEGHSSSSNSFSILPVEEIVHTASDMGIVVKYDNFATFDLLKTLEMARDDLYVKQCGQNETSKSEIVETQPSADVPLRLEWLHDESSDIEDFILVESRKKRREKKKVLDSLHLIMQRVRTRKILVSPRREVGHVKPPLSNPKRKEKK
jgi:hypothetical protein